MPLEEGKKGQQQVSAYISVIMAYLIFYVYNTSFLHYHVCSMHRRDIQLFVSVCIYPISLLMPVCLVGSKGQTLGMSEDVVSQP